MKKIKLALLYFMCLMSLLLFASCSPKNSIGTLFDAVNIVLENENESLIYSSGKYAYQNMESFEDKMPVYVVTFLKVDGDEISYLTYSVKDEITLIGTSTTVISEEKKSQLEQLDNIESLERIKDSEDLTHKVLEMIEEDEGRRIDEEAYTTGFQLVGEQVESWFFIYAVTPDSFMGPIVAAYNMKTDETLVVDQPVSEMTSINTFRLNSRLIVSKNQILDVVYSDKPTESKWEDVITMFPESKLTIKSSKIISDKIQNGYNAECFNNDAEPINVYSNIEGNIVHTLYIFQDDSWYYTAIIS
ncbi:hypothetical protein [Alkalibacter mobilis]|uniref:hypothetical protein n=1 Tax=Alkalibacter mobilis TaxID=2787712 RepID=UPI00189D871E|nr:hypothetical protein [Alkalibacter mobilis]MBF7095702.1 hypothetical protein [Alkalibacter mobilis]